MPNVASYADVINDWEALLAAIEENLADLPDVEAERATLRQFLDKARALKARQDSLTAQRQRVTQELDELLPQGRDVAIQLRAAARLKLGPRNQRLVQFNVAPLRRRTRRGTVEIPPPEPEIKPGGEPEAVVGPEVEQS